MLVEDPRHLLQAGFLGVDEVVGEVDEERLVADRRARAEHRMPEPERRGLADVDAASVRGHDAAHGREQFLLALRLEFLLELVVGVEMVLDGALRRAGDEDELVGARRQGLLGRVLDEGLVDDRQHLLGARLRRRQEAGAAAGDWKYGRPDACHSGSLLIAVETGES